MPHHSHASRPIAAGAAVVAALLLVPPAYGQVASALLREDEELPGAPGENIDSINNTAVNHVGGYAATVNTSGSGTTLGNVWGNPTGGPGYLIRTETTIGNLEQTSYESFFGLSDAGWVGYSAISTDLDSGTTGLDGCWVDDLVVLNEEMPVPTIPGFFSSFNSRVGITGDGIPYWVGGVTDTQGGSTQFRVLYFSAALTPVLVAGDFIGGVAEPIDTGSDIGFDVRFSALGTNYINDVNVDSSSTNDSVVVINGDAAMAGGGILREDSPISEAIGGLPGENWDNFDRFGITEDGAWLVTGDTNAPSSMDEFVLLTGMIILREGDMIEYGGEMYTLDGSIEGAYLNEDGDWAATWDVDDPSGFNVEALLLNGQIMLLEGEPVDWNGDGVIDAGDMGAIVDNFTGTSSVTLGDRDALNAVNIYFTADVAIDGVEPEGFFCMPAQAAEPPAPELPLDIKPGSCINPFNRRSHGVLPMAVLGTMDADVTQIDLSTVLISRADGIGGALAPNFGPPGPSPTIHDVGTPVMGEGCDCHEAYGDGFDDLLLKFRSADLTAALELDDLLPGDLVELCVTGFFVDGIPFTACDCIRLVPPGTPPGMVNMRSTNVKDAWLDVTPLDDTLDGGGFDAFSRSFPLGTVISVSAAPSQGGKTFVGWRVDGRPVSKYQSLALIVVGESQTIEAVYGAANAGDGLIGGDGGLNLPTGDRPPSQGTPLIP